jgi:hypothetical protein
MGAKWDAEKRKFKEINGSLETPPENHDWSWKEKARSTMPDSQVFLGLVVDDEIQGMVTFSTQTRSSRRPGNAGKCVLYVEYLESAPWNSVVYARENAVYRGVGTRLLSAVVNASVAAGCNGRVGLHSLKQAEGFYASVGFENLGPDPEEGLDYFEGSGY